MPTTVETRNGKLSLDEIGSAWDGNPLFSNFDQGHVFSVSWDLFEENIDRMLDRDGKARALEQVLTLPLRAADWSLVPDPGDTGEAEWVREQLTLPANNGGMSTPIDLVIAQMTSAVLYRRAFFEKVWKVTAEGRVAYDKLAFRPAKVCRIRRDRATLSFQGFRERLPTDHPNARKEGDGWVTIKPDKAFVYIHGQHRNPLDGTSDLKTAYACFESKQKVRFLWFQFLENQVIPKALAQTRNGNEAAFAKKVATLKGGGVLGISEGESVTAFESNGTGAEMFLKAIEYLDHEMFASCLAGFADLAGAAASGRGSFALSKDQSDFFLRSRQAVLSEMGAALTSFAVADLVRWNFGIRGKVPTLRFGELTGSDVADALDLFKTVATSATPSPAVPQEFIGMLVERVAEYLGMDVDRVAKAIGDRAAQASSPGGALRQGVDAAVGLLQEAGITPGGAA